jgi:5-formyltetrahydrofolate cyclo-ligase
MTLEEQKRSIRSRGLAKRRARPNKDEASRQILARFWALPEVIRAASLLMYLDVRSEVRTRHALPTALASEKRIVVPYCVDRELELFRLEDVDELVAGTFGILEPRHELRDADHKHVTVNTVDAIMVPGVAFDQRGARAGHGHGYYDRLLRKARSETPFIALAFACQVFPDIPIAEHDVRMDLVVTEKNIWRAASLTE